MSTSHNHQGATAMTDLDGKTCTHGPSATTGLPCGKPAVSSFTARSGETYYECADHDTSGIFHDHVAAYVKHAHPATRSTSPFLLVSDSTGRIEGYARTDGPNVQVRARRLGCRVVPNGNVA